MTRRHRPERGILDTSVVIQLDRLDDLALLPRFPLITAVTLAALSVGPLVAATDGERVARQIRLQQAEADFDPLPFDAAAARAFGRVAAALRGSGRTSTARSYDAMIAAIALAHELPVYTANPRRLRRDRRPRGDPGSAVGMRAIAAERQAGGGGWWRCGESNPVPPACKAGALPDELHPRVGHPGLEPGASVLSGLRSDHLS